MILLEGGWSCSLALAITIFLFSHSYSGVEANYEAPLKYRQYALNATDLPCGSEVEVKEGEYYLFDSASAIMYESALYAQASANYDSSRKKRDVLDVSTSTSSSNTKSGNGIKVAILQSRAYGGGGNRGYGHHNTGGGGASANKNKYAGGASHGHGGKYGGGGGGGYGQPIQPSVCQWTYFAGEDCSLEMHVIRFRPGDMNCYKQQFIVSDNHTEFKLCGYKKLYPGFRAETPVLNIQYWKLPYTYRHVFKGYVTCTGRAQNPTYDESHQFYTPGDIPGEAGNGHEDNGHEDNGQAKSHQATGVETSSQQTEETSSQPGEARALEEAPAAVENSQPQSNIVENSHPQSHVENSHPQSHIIETKIVTVTKTETFLDDVNAEQQTQNVVAEAEPQKEVKAEKTIRGGGLTLDQKMAKFERKTQFVSHQQPNNVAHNEAQENVGQVVGRDADVEIVDKLEPESLNQAVTQEKVTKSEKFESMVEVLVDEAQVEEFKGVEGTNVEEEKTTEKEAVVLIEETTETHSVEPQTEQLTGRNSHSTSPSSPSDSQYVPPPVGRLTPYPPNYPFPAPVPAPAYGNPYPNVMYRPAPEPVGQIYPYSYDIPMIDPPVDQAYPYVSNNYTPPPPPPAYQPPPPPYGQGPPVDSRPDQQLPVNPSPPYFPPSQPAPSYGPVPTDQYAPPPPSPPPMSPSPTYYGRVEAPSYLYPVPVPANEAPVPIYPYQPGPPEEIYPPPPSYQPYPSPPPPPPVQYYQELSPVPAYPQPQPQPQPYQLQMPEYQDPTPVAAYPQPQPQPESYPVQLQVPPSYPSTGYDYLFTSANDPSLNYVVTCELSYPQPCQPLKISPVSVQPPQQPPPPPSYQPPIYQAPPQTPIYGR